MRKPLTILIALIAQAGAMGLAPADSLVGIATTGSGPSLATQRYVLGQPHTWIEAESAQEVVGFGERHDPQASGGTYMLALDEDLGGHLTFRLHSPESETYSIWLLVHGRGGAHNGFSLSLDDDEPRKVGAPNLRWGWVRLDDRFTFSAGSDHDFTVGLREEASEIDRLLITSDAGFIPPEITVLSPSGGEIWTLDVAQVIRWRSTGTLGPVRIEISADGGATWREVVASTPNDGEYAWSHIPRETGDRYLVRLSEAADGDPLDVSDLPFRISPVANPYDPATTLADRLNLGVLKYSPSAFPSRQDYLEYMAQQGAVGAEMAFRAAVYRGSSKGNMPDYEGIQAYRSENAAGLLIVYNNLYSIHNPRGEGMMGDISMHGDWFLYHQPDTTDEAYRVKNPVNGRHNLYFGHPDLQQYIIDRAITYVQAGASGLEFDSFELMKRGFENGYWADGPVINPKTGQPFTQEEWSADLRQAMEIIRGALDAKFGAGSVQIFINGLRRERVLEYQDLLDGYFREGFCGHSHNKEQPLDSWWFSNRQCEQDIDALILAEADDDYSVLGVGYMPAAPHNQTTDDAALYFVSAMLMGIRGPDTKAFLRSRSWDIAAWPGLSKLQLARFIPLRRYEDLDGIYRREFAGALVFVNPTLESRTLDLPRPMYTMRSNGMWSESRVTSLELGSLRGAILVDARAYSPSTAFADVPFDHPYREEIETLYRAGYTAGCSVDPLMFCPDRAMTRAESAVFVERGVHGADVTPDDPVEQVFTDVALGAWYAKWATALYEDGYTEGCQANPLRYCPDRGHTRVEGAVYYLRMLHSADYQPPEPSGIFDDVPLDWWGAKWAEAAYRGGLIPACEESPLRFCPNDPLTRGLGAYMMVRAKALYGGGP